MLTLRDAAASDLPFLRELFSALRRREWGSAGLDETMLRRLIDMQFDAQQHQYRRAFPESVCKIIEYGGFPVGRVWLNRSPSGFHILDLSVTPSMQRLGIGAGTLARVLDEAAASAVPVTLTVAQNNPAQHLYRKHGFEVTAECPPYFKMCWGDLR